MNPLLSTAILASIDAGKEILKVYNTNFDVEVKDDKSPLTVADKNANSVIISFLENTDVPIISEENKQIPYEVRKNWSSCWIVDPLDGTKEFIKKNGEFTVNIALIKNGIPELGVIYTPVSGELYFAEKNKGAFKFIWKEQVPIERIFSEAERLAPSKWESPLKVVGSRSHMNEDTLNFVKELSKSYETDIVSKGSSLKFCLVAEGSAHVYPRFAPTMEWDTAAGQAICEAVGLEVIDQSTQKPMRYNKENLLNSYFLVKA